MGREHFLSLHKLSEVKLSGHEERRNIEIGTRRSRALHFWGPPLLRAINQQTCG